MTTFELHTSSVITAVPVIGRLRAAHHSFTGRTSVTALALAAKPQNPVLLAAMEAARVAERVGLELYEQGVTEQDVHIIYGELQALRDLQLKRAAAAKDAKKAGEGDMAASRAAWRKSRAARASSRASRTAARRSAAAAAANRERSRSAREPTAADPWEPAGGIGFRDGDGRPGSGDRPDWRHAGLSDRSGGRSSVLGGGDADGDAPNQLERPGGRRSGPSGGVYEDPYGGGPYGGPPGPLTAPWRYWTAASRPFEDLAGELPSAKEATSAAAPTVVQPPMRAGAGHRRSVLARDLLDRDPWPDPAGKPLTAEPASGGQFAFGRRLPMPGAPKAPADSDAGPPPKTPPNAAPPEAAVRAPGEDEESLDGSWDLEICNKGSDRTASPDRQLGLGEAFPAAPASKRQQGADGTLSMKALDLPGRPRRALAKTSSTGPGQLVGVFLACATLTRAAISLRKHSSSCGGRRSGVPSALLTSSIAAVQLGRRPAAQLGGAAVLAALEGAAAAAAVYVAIIDVAATAVAIDANAPELPIATKPAAPAGTTAKGSPQDQPQARQPKGKLAAGCACASGPAQPLGAARAQEARGLGGCSIAALRDDEAKAQLQKQRELKSAALAALAPRGADQKPAPASLVHTSTSAASAQAPRHCATAAPEQALGIHGAVVSAHDKLAGLAAELAGAWARKPPAALSAGGSLWQEVMGGASEDAALQAALQESLLSSVKTQGNGALLASARIRAALLAVPSHAEGSTGVLQQVAALAHVWERARLAGNGPALCTRAWRVELAKAGHTALLSSGTADLLDGYLTFYHALEHDPRADRVLASTSSVEENLFCCKACSQKEKRPSQTQRCASIRAAALAKQAGAFHWGGVGYVPGPDELDAATREALPACRTADELNLPDIYDCDVSSQGQPMRLLEYTSVGCNRVANALDWSPTGEVAYGAHSAVAIYDVEAAKVVATLHGHTGRVNCVRWLPNAGAEASNMADALVSGDANCTVIVWRRCPDRADVPWTAAASLKGHSGVITSLCALRLPHGDLLLVSTAADSEIQQDGWALQQALNVGSRMQHAAALTEVPGEPGWVLLAVGSVDNSVRLLLAPPGGDFAPACRLTGHTDWVRSLAFQQVGGGKLLLASGSQDRSIRLWAIQPAAPAPPAGAGSGGDSVGSSDLTRMIARYAPKLSFAAGGRTLEASLEALLLGHEDWVHSVAWQLHPTPDPRSGPAAEQPQRPCLLSASMDRTMALWRPEAGGVWMCEESVGDAGTSSLGYYGGAWGPDGAGLLAHGFTGALHLWCRGGAGGEGEMWEPREAHGGHYGGVVDACWAVGGAALLTVSADQTARLTAQCDGRWCEIARPQVHGHDFSCVAALPPVVDAGQASGSAAESGPAAGGAGGAPPQHRYASGSEEKVLRVLEAPQAFHDTLALARGGAATAPAQGHRALGALVPALGLSNKAVYAGDALAGASPEGYPGSAQGPAFPEGPDLAPATAPGTVAGAPLEEHLGQSTLWPETVKLYGHAGEVCALAADPRGRFLVSACRAQSARFAAVWLWDTETWSPVGAPLEAHTLTVTQLVFSPCGGHLLSVSRDRSLAVYERCADGAAAPFRVAGRVLRAHARVAWGCAWATCGRVFATGARDCTVKLWRVAAPGEAELPSKPLAVLPDFPSAVTAIAFSPCLPGDCSSAATPAAPSASNGSLTVSAAVEQTRCCLAVGLESGAVEVWAAVVAGGGADTPSVSGLECFSEGGTAGGLSTAGLRLASCGNDHSVRIYRALLS
ncbi:hypothetical protein WJX81_004992 [Elliptochloris bilobata]|uniref:Elongator complex protein 2 n=1 Tax=Elliptochloris bilobata TaxID=381761 RepID=A0AAW1S4Z0_9CHLO